MEGSDGSHGRCLVQSCLGSALVEALANIEGSGLRIDPLRVGLVVLLESLGGGFIVLELILGPGQHEQAFLTVVSALLDRYEILQERNGIAVFALHVALLGILVFEIRIGGPVHLVELARAASESQNGYESDG